MRLVTHLLLSVVFAASVAHGAKAASDAAHPREVQWSFSGVLGTVDRASAQRGYQVYKQVCASCHSMDRMRFRNLEGIGFSADEVKTIAAEYEVQDGPNDEGDMFQRPARPSDAFVSPFKNEKAARASNNGAYPPDLSLMVKARPNGANYVYSLLTGYKEAPAGVTVPEGMYHNAYFPGGLLAMAPPLSDGQVTYEDGTAATVDQMSRDVVAFLQYAAEPEMEHRKEMGLKVLIFLLVSTLFFYAAKKIIWRSVR